jgi:hypothetical protein
MMTTTDKDNFWLVVRECLVAFHDFTRPVAKRRVEFYRVRIESAEPDIASDVFYHNEPFDIACDIAEDHLDMSETMFRTYEQILEGKQIERR